MRQYILLCISCFSAFFNPAYAQQCGNCKTTPSVAQYDLDVQVPQPELKGEKTEGWLEWLQLFWYGKHANAQLFQQNKNCIRFTQPLSAEASVEALPDKNSIELTPLVEEQQILKVGQTYTNLPPPGDVSRFGDYLITGFVKPAGAGYMMHIELQTACSRKTVASAEVPFQSSASSDYTMSIVQQALAKLSPLAEKIKQFELKERKERTDFALGGSDRENIKITPAKKNLSAGQETEVEVLLQDCDGEPLSGRTISFTEGSVNGMPVKGTIGGVITPAKVTTDAGGKANAKFKKTATASQPALINAHHLTATSLNCNDAFIGSTQIDALPAYKVTVNYQKLSQGSFVMKTKDQMFSMNLADEKFESAVFANTTFYYYPKAGEKNISIDRENPSSNAVFIMLDGYSDYTKIMKGDEMEVVPLKAGHKFNNDSVQNAFSFHLLMPNVSFSFNNEELSDFDIDFDFPDDGDKPTAGGGVLLIRGDKDAKDAVFSKRKITDPNSLYKTEHKILFRKKTTEKNDYGASTETEFAEIIILSSF